MNPSNTENPESRSEPSPAENESAPTPTGTGSDDLLKACGHPLGMWCLCRKYIKKGMPPFDYHFEELEEEGWVHGEPE